jgi:hypothetical protein
VSWTRRDRPIWVRSANALGRGLAALGLQPGRLDEQTLLATAARRTGLSDFGDDRFREPFALFVHALEHEAELTAVGRALARREVLTLLENRLQVEETYRRHPEISDQQLAGPLFVTGTGRSGTSILHELLAQDPSHRVLLTWEALHPCPPPRSADQTSDPRIRIAEREVRFWERVAPVYRTMHENGARVPQECIYLTAHAFASDLLSGTYAVPSYAGWLAAADLRHAYQVHARILKLLQWRHRRERWVLKAPSHLWALESLLAVYPDARIVQTHRDPLAVIASMTSLMATLLWMRSDRVDARALGDRAVRSIGYMLRQSLRFRDGGGIDPAQICDVRYPDFLADPIATVAGVYDHFGLELSAQAESAMRAYLAAKPKDRHGAHAWRFEDTGIDLAAARERFSTYRERFDLPAEI